MTKQIAFLGAGNMSGAIIEGLLSTGMHPQLITATNRSPEKIDHWRSRGIKAHSNNRMATEQADIVVLGVKPAMMDELLIDIASSLKAGAVIISVAAGVPLSNYELRCPNHAIVRVMPNTPCLVRMGVSGILFNSLVTGEQKDQVDRLFAPLGEIYYCRDEEDIDRVIAIAGSAPAYHFLFLESIVATGVEQGLSELEARRMAIQTALGAAVMAQQSQKSLSQLRLDVTSPGGTTAEAIKHFEVSEIRSIVARAMTACVDRAREMQNELSITKEI